MLPHASSNNCSSPSKGGNVGVILPDAYVHGQYTPYAIDQANYSQDHSGLTPIYHAPYQSRSPIVYSPGSVHGRPAPARSIASFSAPDQVVERHGEEPIPDFIRCQICLKLPTACSCKGGKEAREEMRRAAYEVYKRRHCPEGRVQNLAIATQAPVYENNAGYSVHPGSPVVAYPGHGGGLPMMGGYPTVYSAEAEQRMSPSFNSGLKAGTTWRSCEK
ncbi:hypothetical protein BD309DRAFT_484703 [Dichomitus squalens]|nr:hypothetical protein BD309DRAFT_484703 [Dichomitus squalens]